MPKSKKKASSKDHVYYGTLVSEETRGKRGSRPFETTLENCPPGLFWFNGFLGFKTEYSDQNGPEAYCTETGEYFWGGTTDKEARKKLKVIPVVLLTNGEAHE